MSHLAQLNKFQALQHTPFSITDYPSPKRHETIHMQIQQSLKCKERVYQAIPNHPIELLNHSPRNEESSFQIK